MAIEPGPYRTWGVLRCSSPSLFYVTLVFSLPPTSASLGSFRLPNRGHLFFFHLCLYFTIPPPILGDFPPRRSTFVLYPDRRRRRLTLTASPSSGLDRFFSVLCHVGPREPCRLARPPKYRPPIFLFYFSGFLRVWVTGAFTAPQGRQILGNHIPAFVDPLELCSDSRELPNHGGNYALPFYVPFRLCYFLGGVHVALPFTLYDAPVGPL